jgi:hypothetical protein
MNKPVSFFITLALSSFIWMIGCGKDDEPAQQAELPQATQQGSNTLGFVVKGANWLPAYKCSFGGSSCGEVDMNYAITTYPETIFTLFANRRLEKNSSLSITIKPGATITSTGNKTDSIRVVYTSEDWQGSTNRGRYVGPLAGSTFTITKLDAQGQIIAGTFELQMADSVDNTSRLKLESGRFDFKFSACRCGN